ncbi:MAG: TdeIII family type II restriction endonuclease [Anaerolineales bacterium]|nr:TdeIII family type II restriction endonuclease [Anaerolineales bacterium]
MPLSNDQIVRIEEVLRSSLRNKIRNYKPEPNSMPFHIRLLGIDRLAIYSFIHSLNTNFGTTIFEPIAVELASTNFRVAERQVTAGKKISVMAQQEIQRIIDQLTTAEIEPDKQREVERIRNVSQMGEMVKVNLTKVDLYLVSESHKIYCFDLKTAKPNAGDFREYKRTLLEWVAAILAENPALQISTVIAIPYNPYAPKPYARWTIRGMLDLENELRVAEEFWNFLGGDHTYEALLDIFEKVGIELRPEIDTAFGKFH